MSLLVILCASTPCVSIFLSFEQKGDAGVLGDVEFFPKNIFSLKYYPYYGKQRHVSIHTRVADAASV